MNNTEKADNGTEVYINRLFELCDQYVEQELDGDDEKIKRRFRDLIFYISDRIRKPDNNDIEALDSLFDAYVRLCCRCEKLPTLELFAMLTKIDRNTFTDWKRGEYRNKLYYTMDGELIGNINTWRFNHKGQEYREVSSTTYSRTVEKWYNICKGFAIDELSNNNFANANLIFIAKAAYNLRETAPIPAPEPERKRLMSMDELPRLGDYEEEPQAHKQDELPVLGDGADDDGLALIEDETEGHY